MKKAVVIAWAGLALSLASLVQADSAPANPSAIERNPWEKLSLSLGVFINSTNTGVRVGEGLGVDLDAEDLLGLEDHSTVMRGEAFWRFTSNRKHRLDLSWFGLRRSAQRQASRDFTIQDENGNDVNVTAGTNLDTHFNMDIIEGAYSYSFIQDERLDLAAVGGLYIMPINFGLNVTGATNSNQKINFTAPLPVAGLRLDVAMTPKWFLRTGTQFFAIEYKSFKGSLTTLHAAVEYLPFRHMGVGVGIDNMRFRMEAAGNEDYPNVNLKGDVDFQTTGIQLYGKIFF